MATWLIPSNESAYDHLNSFLLNGFVDWTQGNYKYSVGDVVYIYSSAPESRIKFKASVEAINIPLGKEINDRKFWKKPGFYEKSRIGFFVRLRLLAVTEGLALGKTDLERNGIKTASLAGHIRLTGKADDYVESHFGKRFSPASYTLFEEGQIRETPIERTERSRSAREACIAEKGLRCRVRGMSFEETYGKVKKGYINIHHIAPISSLKGVHSINPKNRSCSRLSQLPRDVA